MGVCDQVIEGFKYIIAIPITIVTAQFFALAVLIIERGELRRKLLRKDLEQS